MTGRPTDPTRARRGTGHRRKPGEAPAPAKGLRAVGPDERAPLDVTPPDDLPQDVHDLWHECMLELAHRGLKAVDRESIRQLCLAALRARQAADELATWGLIVEGQHGPIANPMLKIERDATLTYQRIAAQFGLTIAARLRLGLTQLAGANLTAQLAASVDGPPVPTPPKKVKNTAKGTKTSKAKGAAKPKK